MRRKKNDLSKRTSYDLMVLVFMGLGVRGAGCSLGFSIAGAGFWHFTKGTTKAGVSGKDFCLAAFEGALNILCIVVLGCISDCR